MSIRIGKGRFSAAVDAQGAELKSLLDTETNQEYIWGGDPAWWNGSAPVLFPVIGGLSGGTCRYRGREYALSSHGFARQKCFRNAGASPDSLNLELVPDKEIKSIYPFDFLLNVSFHMDYCGITVRYTVQNTGGEQMFFSIGSHPAFRLPFAGGILEHYYIEFDRAEHAQRYFFENGCIRSDAAPVLSNSRQLFLTRSLFDAGPIIFKDIASQEISIRKSRSERRITVVSDTPYLAIWSKPKGAPFLCIEPWHGIPDPIGFTGDISEKPGIISLGAGDSFSTAYSIQIT